jgi:hypothetical protein
MVVMAVLRTMPGELCAGEEDDRQYEDGAGHDHHPRRHLIQPGVPRYQRRRSSW